MFGCLFFWSSVFALCDSVTKSPATKMTYFLQLLVFLKAKESLTITPFWHRRPQVFPKSCCNHELNSSTKKMMTLSLISRRYINCTQKNIVTNRKLVTLYVCNTLHEDMPPQEKVAPLTKTFRGFFSPYPKVRLKPPSHLDEN